MLAETSRRRALERCKEKGVTRLPVAFSIQVMFLVERLRRLEAPYQARLIQLAKTTASRVWGIPCDRLDGKLTHKIKTGRMFPVRSGRDAVMLSGIVAYGGVVQKGETLMVIARGTNWQLVAKELVKGTAELICLHGLHQLGDETYHCVIETADKLELEPWMLQSGGELWRLLLTCIPGAQPIARVLMHLARLPAEPLHSVIATAIEQPQCAQRFWERLVDQTNP